MFAQCRQNTPTGKIIIYLLPEKGKAKKKEDTISQEEPVVEPVSVLYQTADHNEKSNISWRLIGQPNNNRTPNQPPKTLILKNIVIKYKAIGPAQPSASVCVACVWL